MLAHRVTALRLKNIGFSPWNTLLMIIPLVNILMFFMCVIINKNYAKTKKMDLAAKIISLLLLGLIVFGIFLSFA